ncbi:hypothetical protein E4T56_gene6440 [Termitomyces sp. T112]|nr:hypothetical protein E4T56_gene6440 [Termitomyces sp. T112]
MQEYVSIPYTGGPNPRGRYDWGLWPLPFPPLPLPPLPLPPLPPYYLVGAFLFVSSNSSSSSSPIETASRRTCTSSGLALVLRARTVHKAWPPHKQFYGRYKKEKESSAFSKLLSLRKLSAVVLRNL